MAVGVDPPGTPPATAANGSVDDIDDEESIDARTGIEGDGGHGDGAGGVGTGGLIGGGLRRRASLGSRRRQVIAFGIILAALGVLVFRGLGNATEYFKTADQAVADRAHLGSRNFRIEGTVQPGVVQVGQTVRFVIANNGVSVPVTQNSLPPQLFKPGIPVVLDGHFNADGSFNSNLIMVKHSASYQAAHPERVTTVPASTPTPAP